MPIKPIKFFNPPKAINSKVSKEGVHIGGSLSIIAMDWDHNLHIAENLFSELSWGEFSKEKEMSDQIEAITPGDDDASGLTDPDILVERITSALKYIQVENWILFGIGDFECNSFMASVIDIDSKYVERLMEEQKRLRDLAAFPVLMDEDDIDKPFIEVKFTGNVRSYFHFSENYSLFSIFKHFKDISGAANGIVCTEGGVANFYILNENISQVNETRVFRLDTENLEHAFTQMKPNKTFPISWFRIGIGLASIKALEQWPEIKKNSDLKKALVNYFKYAKKELKKKDNDDEPATPNVNQGGGPDLSDDIKSRDLDSLREILGFDDLGIFTGKKRRR